MRDSNDLTVCSVLLWLTLIVHSLRAEPALPVDYADYKHDQGLLRKGLVSGDERSTGCSITYVTI